MLRPERLLVAFAKMGFSSVSVVVVLFDCAVRLDADDVKWGDVTSRVAVGKAEALDSGLLDRRP